MTFYRVQQYDRPSTIAALHGISVEQLVAANPTKPRVQLENGAVTFQALSEGEDLALPGGVSGPYEQPVFLKEPCQPGYIRDSFGACVLLPKPGEQRDGEYMFRGAGGGPGGGKATSPDASEMAPLPPEDLAMLPPCPMPGYVRDAFAACRSPSDGRPLPMGFGGSV